MAKNVYANLLGEWVNLSADPDTKMGELIVSPQQWWEESAPIYSPKVRQNYDTQYEMDYVHIHYKGRDFRINPIFIQIVTE